MTSRLIIAAVSCALLAGPVSSEVPFLPHRPHLVKYRTDLGGWRLEVTRNPFSEEIVCRLRAKNGEAFFQASAVAFRFPREWRVQRAVYRLDGGEPRATREDLPELVPAGAPMDRGGVENSALGLVWIPYLQLAEAHSIAIQARPDRAPRTFHFRGLKRLREVAAKWGCTSTSQFYP